MLNIKVAGIFSKIKFALIDRYHILFKSAALNHLRIQEVLKNPDGTYQLTVKFNSYSELKEYQKKLRRLTVSASGALAMIVVAFVVAPYIMNPNKSSASTFQWSQASWTSKDQTKVGIYPTDNSNTITNFYDSNGVVVNGSNDITLITPVPSNVTDSSYSSAAGFYPSDPSGNYLSNGTLLALKKPQSATCVDTNECVSGATCTGGKCCIDACCGVTSVTVNSLTYGTVIGLDNKCWLDRNLGATQVATSATDSASYGWLFQWGRRVDGHQIRTSGLTNTKYTNPTTSGSLFSITYADWLTVQNDTLWQGASATTNPCPSGFRVPTITEWNNLKLAGSFSSASSMASNVLKLPSAGYRNYTSGALVDVGGRPYYWSSTINGANAYYTYADTSNSYTAYGFARAMGASVRCIKD